MSVPRFQAASRPVPRPMSRKKKAPPRVSETVVGSRSMSVAQTWSLVWYE
jgi:hypothetical protein